MSEPQAFFKSRVQKTFLVRTRVQKIAFERQKFDFESNFAMLFESTTKPQREAQKCLSDGNYFNITRILQSFSKLHTQFLLSNCRLLGITIPRSISLDTNNALEKIMRQTAVKAVPLASFTTKPQRECHGGQKNRKTQGGFCGTDPARSRAYYHRQVRTPYRLAMFGENMK